MGKAAKANQAKKAPMVYMSDRENAAMRGFIAEQKMIQERMNAYTDSGIDSRDLAKDVKWVVIDVPGQPGKFVYTSIEEARRLAEIAQTGGYQVPAAATAPVPATPDPATPANVVPILRGASDPASQPDDDGQDDDEISTALLAAQ